MEKSEFKLFRKIFWWFPLVCILEALIDAILFFLNGDSSPKPFNFFKFYFNISNKIYSTLSWLSNFQELSTLPPFIPPEEYMSNWTFGQVDMKPTYTFLATKVKNNADMYKLLIASYVVGSKFEEMFMSK